MHSRFLSISPGTFLVVPTSTSFAREPCRAGVGNHVRLLLVEHRATRVYPQIKRRVGDCRRERPLGTLTEKRDAACCIPGLMPHGSSAGPFTIEQVQEDATTMP